MNVCLYGSTLTKYTTIFACVLVYPYLLAFCYVRLWVLARNTAHIFFGYIPSTLALLIALIHICFISLGAYFLHMFLLEHVISTYTYRMDIDVYRNTWLLMPC